MTRTGLRGTAPRALIKHGAVGGRRRRGRGLGPLAFRRARPGTILAERSFPGKEQGSSRNRPIRGVLLEEVTDDRMRLGRSPASIATSLLSALHASSSLILVET